MTNFNLPITNFLDIQQKARQQCGQINKTDTDGKTYCLASITDLTHRLLFGVGIRSERGTSKKVPATKVMNIFYQDKEVSFSNDDLKQSVKFTTRFVCNPWKKGLSPHTSKNIKDYSNKRYGQCLKGIKLITKQLN